MGTCWTCGAHEKINPGGQGQAHRSLGKMVWRPTEKKEVSCLCLCTHYAFYGWPELDRQSACFQSDSRMSRHQQKLPNLRAAILTQVIFHMLRKKQNQAERNILSRAQRNPTHPLSVPEAWPSPNSFLLREHTPIKGVSLAQAPP